LSTQAKAAQSLSAQSMSPSPSSSRLLRQSSVVPDPLLLELAAAVDDDEALEDDATLDDDALDEDDPLDADALDEAIIPPVPPPPAPPLPDDVLDASPPLDACVGSN
jgi:hypothetical protein